MQAVLLQILHILCMINNHNLASRTVQPTRPIVSLFYPSNIAIAFAGEGDWLEVEGSTVGHHRRTDRGGHYLNLLFLSLFTFQKHIQRQNPSKIL
jgi:hypothetical protein